VSLIGKTKKEIIERSKAIRQALSQRRADAIRVIKFHNQEGWCYICGKPIQEPTGLLCHVGHAISIYTWAERNISIEEAIAGANDEKNLVVLHPECNLQQERQDMEELLERGVFAKHNIDYPDIIAFRLTKEQSEFVRRRALSKALSVSDYLRSLIEWARQAEENSK